MIEIPPPQMRLTFSLPIPVSTNNLQRSAATGRRYNTKAYERWKEEAGKELIAQRSRLRSSARRLPAGQPYAAILALPSIISMDRDNAMKSALDLLHRAGVTPDDQHNRFGAFAASASVPPGWCRIAVWSITRDEGWVEL